MLRNPLLCGRCHASSETTTRGRYWNEDEDTDEDEDAKDSKAKDPPFVMVNGRPNF